MNGASLLGVDWGTTALRAYLINDTGAIDSQLAWPLGVKRMRDTSYETVLSDIRSAHGWEASRPTLLCGMVGSRSGWHEAPYLGCPAGVADIAGQLLTVAEDSAVKIVPGVSVSQTGSLRDVMRGEETQIVGVSEVHTADLFVLPGTHSKWVQVDSGRILDLRTYVTGELFELIKSRSILGEQMTEGQGDDTAFCAGVNRSLIDPSILSVLFSVRIEFLKAVYQGASLASYLSGLLIGAEVIDSLRRFAPASVIVIGDVQLTRWYQLALELGGVTAIRTVDGCAAAARGLWRIAVEGGLLE